MNQPRIVISRRRRPVLVVDHAEWDYRAVSSAARDAALLPQAVPNAERARIHLAGEDRFEGLLLPAALGTREVVALAREARRLRPTMRIVVIANDASRAGEIEAALGDASDAGRLAADRVLFETEHALVQDLERIFCEDTPVSPDSPVSPVSPERPGATDWGNAA